MILSWMVYGTLISLMLGLAALAIERVCRMRGWASRWVWTVAMVAPLLLPLLPWSGSPAGAGVGMTGAVEGVVPPVAPAQRAVTPPPGARFARIDFAREMRKLERAGRLDGALMVAWLSASALLFIGLAAGWLRLRSKSASWQPGEIENTEVLVADQVGPAVFGLLHPRIVVPAWLLHADDMIQRAALTHERQHIAAKDPQLLAATFVLLVLLPWNLPLWWQWRRLRFAIEVDCDTRVLSGGQKIAEYGGALLNVAQRRSDIPLMSPAMHDSGSSLERRIRLMLADRHSWPRSVSGALALSAVTLAAAAAQITPPAAIEATSTQQSATGRDPVSSALGRELMNAAQRGDLNTATALIDAGADVNRVVHGDGTPMIAAARRGDLRLVQLLLQHGADVNLACDGDGNPLIMAAARGRLEIVAALVEGGADVNGVVIGDETPLINAARNGRLDVVEYLVERGADVNLAVPADRRPSAEIRSPLGEATRHHHGAVAEYLRGKGATS